VSKDQRVLITGAGGYLGSVLTRLLLEEGHEVIALDRFYFGEEPLASLAGHRRLRIVKGDVRTLDVALLEQVGAVVNLAALSNDPSCELDPAWTLEVNRDAAIRLAQLCKERGVERFLFSSSCSVYGTGSELLTEDSELRPVSLYARCKVEVEEALSSLADSSFHPVVLRKGTLFGLSPRMRFDLAVNLMTMHAVTKGCIYVTGGGQQWRPFLHVRDAANAYLLCLEAPGEKVSGRIFNVSADNEKIASLAERVARTLGNITVHCVPEDQDKRNYHVSGARFAGEFGFRPAYTIEDGVREIAGAIGEGRLGELSDRRYYTLKVLQHALEVPACEGGSPVRSSFLPFALPLIGKPEEDEVLDTLRSGWLTTGPKTKRFEEMCRDYLGCRHAIALNSCTGALHVAVAAAGIGQGDEVITTPISWPATANVVLLQGGKPVFVDVEPDTLNIDVSKIEAAITPRTKAILPVHMAGQPCQLQPIRQIARQHGLVVIEDAAHAIGAEFEGARIGSGSGSLATAFSFYPIKNMTTIEGGLLATPNDEFAEKASILSLHGISRDAWKRYSNAASLHWQLLYPGFKYNMTDVQASLGLHQIKRLDEFIQIRREYADLYDRAFADLPALRPLARRPGMRHAHHLYILLLQTEYLRINRDQFMVALKSENIGTGVHFISMHLQPYYQQTHGLKAEDFPVAHWASDRMISLPLYPKMTKADLQSVIHAVRRLVRYYLTDPDQTRRRLAEAAEARV
jgi:dTDP-4-amino-4,6-dideoxygalactose transaminase/nucleoside-diphosphate-sugar epimerase